MDVNWNVCVQLREQIAKGLAAGLSFLFKSRVEAVLKLVVVWMLRSTTFEV